MNEWSAVKNLLCIRLDNMGDLLMSNPAIRALKKTFNCRITVLTSPRAQGITDFMPEIDDTIVYDVPWVKTDQHIDADSITEIVKVLQERQFDAVVMFTVFSQNPLPVALLAYMAKIPLRLAYCRENPYQLLTHWVPEKEPYTFIRHQVQRDLELVKAVGASIEDDSICIRRSIDVSASLEKKFSDAGVDIKRPWLVLHAGVSERKREYPAHLWTEAASMIRNQLGYQIILTGTENERALTDKIKEGAGDGLYSLAGVFDLEEFILLVRQTPVVVSVNTATIHIAAAVQTPVVVLYALTNPQHTPWKVLSKVLLFDVPEELRSRNEVLQFVRDDYFTEDTPMVTPDEIVKATAELLQERVGKPKLEVG